MIEQARRTYQPPEADPAEPLRRKEFEIVAEMDRYLVLACGLQDPTPALEKVDELQQARRGLQQDIHGCEAEFVAARALASVTDGQIERVLRDTGHQVRDQQGERLKDLMRQLIGKIEIHPTSGECRIEYMIGIDSNNLGDMAGKESDPLGFEPMVIGNRNRMASPRGRGPNPVETDPMSIGYRNKMGSPRGRQMKSP